MLCTNRPSSGTWWSWILEWTDIICVTELTHFIVPVAYQCRWTYHKRWEGHSIYMTCVLKEGRRGVRGKIVSLFQRMLCVLVSTFRSFRVYIQSLHNTCTHNYLIILCSVVVITCNYTQTLQGLTQSHMWVNNSQRNKPHVYMYAW